MPGARIAEVRGFEILDSRGWPTVEARIRLDDGTVGSAAVPSGASTGKHEAIELRDGDKARFLGRGVTNAVRHLEGEIQEALKGQDPCDQRAVDRTMIRSDGTANKGALGANAILAASLAVSRAAAAFRRVPLYAHLRETFGRAAKEWLMPAPLMNVINGGKHADSGLDIQEFMVVPFRFATFAEALRAGAEIYQTLRNLLSDRNLSTAVGDEGGFAPRLENHEAALDLLATAVEKAGCKGKVRLSLDCAASSFYEGGKYRFEGGLRSAEEMEKTYGRWISRYGLMSIEDGLDEEDWGGWKNLTDRFGRDLRLVGDDIFVTNPARLKRGIKEGVANAILIKLNQIGTLTETAETVEEAHKAGYACIVSHRSGETEDSYIADLAVALNVGAIKTGAPCRSERLAKYNRLLHIEAELGSNARYAGDKALRPESRAFVAGA